MLRTATVLLAARSSEPQENEPAILVVTDYHVNAERAFYLRPDSEMPVEGQPIRYGDHRAWYGTTVARKMGYNFDPDRPFR